MDMARKSIILSAFALTACATPVYRNSFAEGGNRIGQEQINAELKDVYSRFMRFHAWILGLTRFEW